MLSKPSTDVSWSSYNNSVEVISELDLLEKGISDNNSASAERLLCLLVPTSDLQEISIDSGWEDKFIDIARSLESSLKSFLMLSK